jgi:NADH-quinone oxidoreductase subunit L
VLDLVWLAIAFPLLGATLNGFFGRQLTKRVSGIIGCGAVAAAFAVALGTLFDYIGRGLPGSENPYHEVVLWPWIHSGALKIDMAFLVDPLSITMMLLITGVGFLIHLYSTSYMSHDEGYPRFFTYLNLFVAMMLVLVLGNNTALMFVGWEGVGLCSYLLIGFWYRNMENANAGMKAFVVNRIGDFGVLLGMFMIFMYFGSITYTEIFSRSAEVLSGLEGGLITAMALLLFLGATGKSAQLPLHIWLPDAMAGPTPVSALIHAATMVTAGVYMVTRLNPIFTASPTAGFVVALVGLLTAFMAATIALTQNDIKKVLAYSTVSQLGFMFLAAGVGAYWVAMFHVLTHAFFKACLFLGSGSVIHAMHEEQDTRVMGGLAKYMKVTYFTFLISTLAIAGIFPLAGFFSKDEILWRVATWEGRFEWGPAVFYFVALLTAFMTAFYMGRVTFKTFLGQPRWTEHFVKHHHHPHESSPAMTVPLQILAALAIVGGFTLFTPAWLGHNLLLEHWLSPSAGGEAQQHFIGVDASHGSGHELEGEHAENVEHAETHHEPFISFGSVTASEVAFALLSLIVAILGLLLAHSLYVKRFGATEKLRRQWVPLYRFSLNKWYFDELYHKLIVVPGVALAHLFWRIVDVKVIDGIVNGTAWVLGALGWAVKPLQTGFVRNYALYLLVGAVIFVVLNLFGAGGK